MIRSEEYDVSIVGGGIVGLATAMHLASRSSGSLVVLEAEDRLAAHQSGHNSGVIHSGLYYQPGSLKARYCVEGRAALLRFCRERGIRYELPGKLIVARHEDELPALSELEQRGCANGLRGIRILGRDALREREPHVSGAAALFVPETGIVDFAEVAHAFAAVVREAGGQIRTGARLRRVRRKRGMLQLETSSGQITCRNLINCGGLYSDRIARMCGVDPGLQIIPFRGEYYKLIPRRRHLVRNLVYPVPDPRFPFLGVHFTRTILGEVQAGPNAVLALKREGYHRSSFSPADVLDFLSYRGFWRLTRNYWRTGIDEFRRSLSKRVFTEALRSLVPELGEGDLQSAAAGVRAQAVGPDGRMIDDFRIVHAERTVHVLNAPSPAATAAISIGQHIADLARAHFCDR